MKNKKAVYIDILFAIIYIALWIIFGKSKAFGLINFATVLFALIFDCVLYCRKKRFVAVFLNIALVITSVGNITVQIVESAAVLVLISFLFGATIAMLVFRKDKHPNMLIVLVVVVAISAVVFGQIQNLDKVFAKENKTCVDLEVERKYISGRFGLYDYSLETSEYNGDGLMINVDKSIYESTNEGDPITVEIQEGLFGYHYYFLSECEQGS